MSTEHVHTFSSNARPVAFTLRVKDIVALAFLAAGREGDGLAETRGGVEGPLSLHNQAVYLRA